MCLDHRSMAWSAVQNGHERSKMQSNQPLWPAARTSERRCPRAGASPGATTHIWLFRYLEVGHPVKLQWNLTVDLSWTQNTQVIASSTKQEIPERKKKTFFQGHHLANQYWKSMESGPIRRVTTSWRFFFRATAWLPGSFCDQLRWMRICKPAKLYIDRQLADWNGNTAFFGPEIPRTTTCDVYKTL